MISQDEKEKNVVLFVDDDPQALRIGKFLERYGFIFKVTSDPNKALEWVEENHLDLVLVDLRMSPMDGVELTEEIKKIRPGIPIVVFSAFLRDSFWKGKVKKAQDYFEDILEKPFPVAEDRIMDFCQRLQAIINKHKKDYSEPDAESFPEQLEDPFSVSFQSYLKLDHKVTRQIRRRAWELRRDWFLDGIKKERWDWVVLCGSELVKSSLQGAPLPTEDELADLGNRHERIPFLFVRPPVIEEVAWSGMSRRHLDNRTVDYYPTIACSVELDSGQLHSLQGDLDTGAFVSCISSDIVPVSNLGPVQNSEHLSEEYEFTMQWLKFVLEDEQNRQSSINLPVYVILDWKTGPFIKVNPQRQLLAGRDLLNSLKLRIILDSSQRKTFLEF